MKAVADEIKYETEASEEYRLVQERKAEYARLVELPVKPGITVADLQFLCEKRRDFMGTFSSPYTDDSRFYTVSRLGRLRTLVEEGN